MSEDVNGANIFDYIKNKGSSQSTPFQRPLNSAGTSSSNQASRITQKTSESNSDPTIQPQSYAPRQSQTFVNPSFALRPRLKLKKKKKKPSKNKVPIAIALSLFSSIFGIMML